MSKQSLSFLFSVLCASSIPALSLAESAVVTPDVSIDPSTSQITAEEPATKTVSDTDAASEPDDPVAEQTTVEAAPEVVAEEVPVVNAAEVVVPAAAAAAVASDVLSPATDPVTDATLENAPASVVDKVESTPAVDETVSPVKEQSTEKASDQTKTTGVVDENAVAVNATEPVASEVKTDNPLAATKMEFFIGASLMDFDYTELATDDSWLDEETGMLPGFILGGTLFWPKWYASLELNYYSGAVDYRGQTQSSNPALSGLPITSRSDTDIFDTTAIVGYQLPSMTVYGGLGYYYWRRNIRPTTTRGGLSVAGALEFYSWTYALLGLHTPLIKTEDADISFDVRATRMLDAQMEVDFLGYGGYDNANLNLGEDWGLRLALPWTFGLSGKDSPVVTIEPYYTLWDLKRSDVVERTVDGAGTGQGVVEPRSETRNLGISVYLRYSM